MYAKCNFLLCGLQRKFFTNRSHEPGKIKGDVPYRNRSGFIASDVQKTVGQVADASQILGHSIDDFLLLRIGRFSLKQFDCEGQRCQRRSEFIRKRSDQIRACTLLVTKISHVMKSDHRAEQSAINESQWCRFEKICMIAAANMQTYFGLLFASRISQSTPKGGTHIYVVTIVFVKTEERTTQNLCAIDTNYQCSLLVEIGNDCVDIYQDHRNVETSQDCRRFFVFVGSGCEFHSGPRPI